MGVVMSEEQGQAAEQPALSVEDQALSVASGILQAEEEPEATQEKLRDEKTGKFVKAETDEAKPETEAEPEEKAEGDVEEETPEFDWDKIKSFRKKLTVKNEAGDDEDVELSLEDMERGVMLERAFRMKTAQLAREKESFQAKIKEATAAKEKEYEDKLQLAEQAIWHTLAPEMQNIDWNKLAAEDPAEWARKYQHVQNVNGKLAQIQQERKKLAESKEAESKAELRKKVEESVETLRSEIPGWNDDLYRKIISAGVTQGFKSEEVNAIIDPRAIKVLWKAMKYDDLQKAKPTVEKRAAQQAPKVVKPGAGEKPSADADKWKEGMARLQKSGRTEDAVELAKLMFASEAQNNKNNKRN